MRGPKPPAVTLGAEERQGLAARVRGAAIYGLYGLVRGGAVWALLLAMALRPGSTPLAFRLLLHVAVARTVAAAALLSLGLVVAIVAKL